MYPLYDEIRYYRGSEDTEIDPQQPIKKAFLRTYKKPRTEGNATIVSGHYTNISQPGKHYVWLRDPLARDVSHFNYDCKYKNELSRDFTRHLSQMSGNFLVLWLFGKYIGRHDSVSMEERYNAVKKVLKEKFYRVYDSDKFEDSWTDICDELNISCDPRLNSNQSDKDYQKIQKYSDLSEEFKKWHRSYNHFDYLLYEEFCA